MMLLNKARQIAHKWETQRKNQRWLEALENHLKTTDPMLIVHQMGRAASMSTVNTLREAGITYPVYHTHWLNPASLTKRLEWLKGLPAKQHPLNVCVGHRIAEEIQNVGIGQRQWKLVSIFREPVGRNISTFFLTIENFFEDFFRRYECGEISLEQVLETFLREYRHEMPLQWFDKEVGEVFGIDVYEPAFPMEKGYQIIKNGNVEILLIKMERLNDCFQEAFENFLGTRIPNLALTHITEKDPSYYMYKEFLGKVTIPAEYLEQMYGSRFAKHFYRPEEIQDLMDKWSRRR